MLEKNKIYHVDSLIGLPLLQEKSINCCVTSPPYYMLRDYAIPKSTWPQIEYTLFMTKITVPEMTCCLGLENNLYDYIGHMIHMFRLVKRVLKDDGTIWCNIGDSYATSSNSAYQGKNGQRSGREFTTEGMPAKGVSSSVKAKDMLGVPWILVFALREDGWYLRQDIIWYKTSRMPESVTDRCTKSHEYIFLLSKNKKYYYDARAIATPFKDKTYTTFGTNPKGYGDGTGMIASENWHNRIEKRKPKDWNPKQLTSWKKGKGSHNTIDHSRERTVREKIAAEDKVGGRGLIGHSGNQRADGSLVGNGFANKISVWPVYPKPYNPKVSKKRHFATFPEKLIIDCIKAGCPEGGTVLDPFAGTSTVGSVASKLGRNFICFDISADSVEISEERLHHTGKLFN